MQNNSIADNFYNTRLAVFKWRYSLSITHKLMLALGMALVTGLMAQVRIPLPFTPVPITGQTFAVLLAGVLLGRHLGGMSMALYVALGTAGLPWFAGFSGGPTTLIGPTGGYLIGFILAALVIGHISDKFVRARGFWAMFTLMAGVTLGLIFVPGLLQLGLWVTLVKGNPVTLGELLTMGFYPFIAGGIIKVTLAALLTKTITPKEPFGG